MRRLIIAPDAISGDKIHVTDKEGISYLSHVLRMKEGDSLLVSDGAGRAWEARIASISRDGIELDIIKEVNIEDRDNTRVTLYQGLPKGSKMDEIVRKATELGAYDIVPVVTARSIPEAGSISEKKIERWLRIAKEASRQSRRLRVPDVYDVSGMEEAAAGLADAGFDIVLVPYELEEGLTLKQALRESGLSKPREGEKPRNIAVFIGPEGGFEPEEIDSLIQEGAVPVTLGETILRTETAGPAVIAMIQYEFG